MPVTLTPDSVGYCKNGDVIHIREPDGKHYTVQRHPKSDNPYIKEIPKFSGALYGRPKGSTSYSDWSVSLSHGLMNMAAQEGSWAWYTGFGGNKTSARLDVKHTYVPKRHHTLNMNTATMAEINRACSATEYAKNGHGAWFTSGHRHIPYEWCHLASHGLGGSDTADNIVAATAFQNTEQLILENVLYEYRTEGLAIQVQARLASGTEHLAESIYYAVWLGAAKIYSRTMDARRAVNVTYDEYASVAKTMRQAINNALGKEYPIKDFDREMLTFVEDLTAIPDFKIC